MPGPTVTVRSTRSTLLDLVHALDVDHDPALERQRAVVQPGAAGARHDRDPMPVRELHDLADLLGGARQDHEVGDVLGPAVDRERRRHAGAVVARGLAGQHALVAEDGAQLVEDASRAIGRWRSCRSPPACGPAAPLTPRASRPADSATSSIRSRTSMPCFGALAADSGRSDQTQALTRVSTSSSRRPRDPATADLGGDLRLLDREARAGAGAVRPLRHVVDVLEGESGDGAQDLARRRVDALALVQPARVVVRHHPLDRLSSGSASRPGSARPRAR